MGLEGVDHALKTSTCHFPIDGAPRSITAQLTRCPLDRLVQLSYFGGDGSCRSPASDRRLCPVCCQACEGPPSGTPPRPHRHRALALRLRAGIKVAQRAAPSSTRHAAQVRVATDVVARKASVAEYDAIILVSFFSRHTDPTAHIINRDQSFDDCRPTRTVRWVRFAPRLHRIAAQSARGGAIELRSPGTSDAGSGV